MESSQIEKVLLQISQNKKESNDLGEALEAFTDQFERLIDSLQTTLNIEKLGQTGKQAEVLVDKVSDYDGKMTSMLTQMEKLQVSAKAMPPLASTNALVHHGQLFVVSEDRKEVKAYNLRSKQACCFYGVEDIIEQLFIYKEEVHCFVKTGRICTLHGEWLSMPNLTSFKVVPEGVVGLDQIGRLVYYTTLRHLHVLAENVDRFDYIGEEQLIYIKAGTCYLGTFNQDGLEAQYPLGEMH
ncbi:hypothetical protein [Niameybacter massiliensis]|uniref:hypothetical protein n=1 Tax=Niameybacter massiliensis TaxID=1658108 RepID=UPI0006B64173|nr:hypothetical protein [Niameybacter massiliensis]